MPPEDGLRQRLPWAELPVSLRTAIEETLESPVVAADSRPGGFSPGSADRVTLADGRRAFVKAVSADANADSPAIHLREAAVLAAMPPDAPTAHLIALIEDGPWVALILTDIDGRHPTVPWRADEVARTLDALHELSRDAVPPALGAGLPGLEDELAGLFDGWAELDPEDDLHLPGELEGWTRRRLTDLNALAAESLPLVAGDRLVHVDIRADNLLIRPDGDVIVVDWPWASRGASWFDALALLVNVRYYDPQFDVDAVIDAHPVFAAMPAGATLRVLAGLSGFFVSASVQPSPAGIPHLRTFQRDQGVAALEWIRHHRLG